MYCQKCGKEILDDAVVCIHCGREVKRQVKPWGKGFMTFMIIFSLLIPPAGIIAGIVGLLNSSRRTQAIILLGISVSAALFWSTLNSVREQMYSELYAPTAIDDFEYRALPVPSEDYFFEEYPFEDYYPENDFDDTYFYHDYFYDSYYKF